MLRSFKACLLLWAALPLAAQQSGQWQLRWSDEFDGPAGSAPNPKSWTYDLGGGGWGNEELEVYTNSRDNSYLDGQGHLIIQVLQASPGHYTSARLKTQGLVTQRYGRIEARIRIPFGQGIWPAFWMLGQNISQVGWPQCGEVDIMENIGREPAINHGSVHGPGYSGGNDLTASYTLKDGQKLADDFHVYALEWRPDRLEFFFDGTSYEKVTKSSLPKGTQWVFDKPFFLLLNVAVGGSWPGSPNASTQFPQTMTVDYVRVYRNANEPIVDAGGVVNAASFGGSLAPGALASLFGSGLAGGEQSGLYDTAQGRFPASSGEVAVTVGGKEAPLTYVSPQQINFQIPWDAPLGDAAIQVKRGDFVSNQEPVSLAATAPAVFGLNGVALLTCAGSLVRIGADCTLWGNGFGQKTSPQADGAPATATPLPQAVAECSLLIGGMAAQVTYCGSAPGLVIDQLNFVYPGVVQPEGGSLMARLKVGDQLVGFAVPPAAP